MDSPKRTTKRYADQVKLSLAGQRYLTEQQERELLLEALDTGLSLEEARGLLAATVAKRHAAREMTLDRDMALTIAIFAGAKGWISRTTFEHPALEKMLAEIPHDHGCVVNSFQHSAEYRMVLASSLPQCASLAGDCD